jgi:hypothetical protein
MVINKNNITILVISLFTLLILGGVIEYNSFADKRHMEYETIFTKTTLDILQQVILCKEMSQLTSQTWYNDKYNNSNFNTSLPNLYNSFQNKNTLNEMEKSKNNIEKEIIKLQNPPPDYVSAYYLFVQLDRDYEQIYLQSIKPSGSLSSYISGVYNKSTEFYVIYDKIILLKSRINSSVLIYNPIYIF